MSPAAAKTTRSDLAAELGFELHAAARLFRHSFERRAAAHGVSRAGWQVLWVIARREGLKQAELAEIMGVAPISASRQIDRLEQDNLIERRRDPQDRRCFRLYLTDAAQPLLDQLRPIALENRRIAIKGFTAAEVSELHTLLLRVRANLSDEEALSP
jgi:DNA-binding MarR family transcriptional regulator